MRWQAASSIINNLIIRCNAWLAHHRLLDGRKVEQGLEAVCCPMMV
jgi:hypothetical protein